MIFSAQRKSPIFLTCSSDNLCPTHTRLAQTSKLDLLFCFQIHIQCLIGPYPVDPNACPTWTHLLACTYPLSVPSPNFSILERSLNKKPMLMQLFIHLIMKNKEFNRDSFITSLFIVLPHTRKQSLKNFKKKIQNYIHLKKAGKPICS